MFSYMSGKNKMKNVTQYYFINITGEKYLDLISK